MLVVNPHLAGASDDRAGVARESRVAIPDQVVTQGPLTVEVTGLSCEGFDVASVTSDSNVVEGTASVSVRGAQCACSGKWAVKAVGLSGRWPPRPGIRLEPRPRPARGGPGGSADAVSSPRSAAALRRRREGMRGEDRGGVSRVLRAGAGVVSALAPMLGESRRVEPAPRARRRRRARPVALRRDRAPRLVHRGRAQAYPLPLPAPRRSGWRISRADPMPSVPPRLMWR